MVFSWFSILIFFSLHLQVPASYQPIRTPARKLMSTPTPLAGTPLYVMPSEETRTRIGMLVYLSFLGAHTFLVICTDIPSNLPTDLPDIKPEDMQYFASLLQDVNPDEMDVEERKEREILEFLLKIKNGDPPMRKVALRQITDRAREFGPGPLFNQVLLSMSSFFFFSFSDRFFCVCIHRFFLS